MKKITPLSFSYPISLLHKKHIEWKLSKEQRLTHFQQVADKFDHHLELVIEDRLGMPRSKSANSMFSTKFASINLTKEEKATAKGWINANINDFEVYWVNLGVDGWKQSSSYDSENDCWIVSLTQRDEKDQNYDVCVTSRAGNPLEALMLSMYKILMLYPNAKLPTERERDNWG